MQVEPVALASVGTRADKRVCINLSRTASKRMMHDMDPIRIETKVDEHGEVHLTKLPFSAGELVEVVVVRKLSRQSGHDFPLRGVPIKYNRPTDPVAENEWDALR